MNKHIVISENHNLAVVFEGNKAAEFIMRQGDQFVGDIILGRVESIVPAIEAMFIDIGYDKNGFIHTADMPAEHNRRHGRQKPLEAGQRVLVQIAKAPTGTKGARLTGRISVPGRFLVFVPHDNRVCISRRITEGKERDRLKRIATSLKDPGHGLIVRTEAIGASEEELRKDIEDLIDRWAAILHEAQTRPAPALLHRDQDLITRVIRDWVSSDIDKLVIDTQEGYAKAKAILADWMPDMVDRLELHRGKDLMAAHRIPHELEQAIQKTVRLPSGGSIVIELTEALTVIDVNSGRLTSSKSLQDTVLRTNLEAAQEIARQIRLRDIGGIIIIDFISMDYAQDRQKVQRALEEALRPDKSRPQISESFSEHGLIEVARRRQGQSLVEQLTSGCLHCKGVGRIRNDIFRLGAPLGTGPVIEVTSEEEEGLQAEDLLGTDLGDAGAFEVVESTGAVTPSVRTERGERVEEEDQGEREGRRRRRRRRGGRGRGRDERGGATDETEERADDSEDETEEPIVEVMTFGEDEEGLDDEEATEAPDGPSERGSDDGERRGRRRRRRGRGRGDRGRERADEATERSADSAAAAPVPSFVRPGVRPGSGFARPGAPVAPAVALAEAPVLPPSQPPASESPDPVEDKAPKLPKGLTPPRPVVGPVTRTEPYRPRATGARPQMVMREVAPGIMQMVPVVQDTPAVPASEEPSDAGDPSPVGQSADAPVAQDPAEALAPGEAQVTPEQDVPAIAEVIQVEKPRARRGTRRLAPQAEVPAPEVTEGTVPEETAGEETAPSGRKMGPLARAKAALTGRGRRTSED
ncbi:MAG: Rne/Rng family ribonuclease [Candidatus Sericytochromatia bacterium]|nr:Rne/Rng family ribonuclease [Candidatus Sericytochromatia bacterium]